MPDDALDIRTYTSITGDRGPSTAIEPVDQLVRKAKRVGYRVHDLDITGYAC